jgi:hypothetical protein
MAELLPSQHEQLLGAGIIAAAATPTDTLRTVVTVLQYAYPIVMLLFFLVAFTARSIISSNSNSNVSKPTTLGPGGKPLPATDPTRNFVKRQIDNDVTRSQKLVFGWLSVAAAGTFVGNAINVIVHALYARKDQWWCGQAQVVGPGRHVHLSAITMHCAHSFLPDLHRWRLLHLLSLPYYARRLQAVAHRRPRRNVELCSHP